jgi:hypothetical protein
VKAYHQREDEGRGVNADVKVGGAINHAVPVAIDVTGGELLILLLGTAVILPARGRGGAPGF